MNIHEYQAKAVLKDFGLPVSRGGAALTVEEAVKAAQELPGPLYVVKRRFMPVARASSRNRPPMPGRCGRLSSTSQPMPRRC